MCCLTSLISICQKVRLYFGSCKMDKQEIDFGDLKDDPQIQPKLENFQNSVKKIDKLLEPVLDKSFYQKLSTKEKVDYDLFMAYALNTLHWLYLRTRGEDPNSNDVKAQIVRVKDYMQKAKQADQRAMRPKIDKNVAERFVRHGTQIRKQQEPPRKKPKLS